MGELRTKYLDMLQGIVNRMAGSQFQCRTWSVALGTAVIGFAAAKDNNPKAALLAVFTAVTFWAMDAYYLALEWKFRSLFNQERQKKDNDPDFSFAFGGLQGSDVLEACKRPAVWLVHSPVLAVAVGVSLLWKR